MTPNTPTFGLYGWSGVLLAWLSLVTLTEGFQFQPHDDPSLLKPFSVSKDVSKDAKVGATDKDTPRPQRQALAHKKWGVDNQYENEYWLDQRIHTLGNVGLGGAFHAALAPLSTKIIDLAAYDGKDIRQEVSRTNEMARLTCASYNYREITLIFGFTVSQVANELRKRVNKTNARILDLCCGVGTSTRSLLKAFPNAETVIGVDSSPEMISMASFLTQHLEMFQPMFEKWFPKSHAIKKAPIQVAASTPCSAARAFFMQANAENTRLQTKSFDLVTIMYAFHEAPQAGRQRMLQEARRLLAPGGTLAIVDISHDYVPSDSMLAGEPYILEYQQNIHRQLQRLKGFCHQSPTYKTLVPGRAGVWLLKRSASAFA